jgi:hypothetical protein
MEKGHASDQTRSVRRAKKTEQGKLSLGVDIIASVRVVAAVNDDDDDVIHEWFRGNQRN